MRLEAPKMKHRLRSTILWLFPSVVTFLIFVAPIITKEGAIGGG